MVPGVILAAGDSSRMGRPKALLPIDRTGCTFVEQIIRTLEEAGIAEILVVVGRDGEAIRRRLERASPQVRLVRNPHPAEGQLSSLLAALQLADRPGVEGLLTTLVDVPLVTPDTVRTLLARHRATRAPVVRPAKDARHGHPVIFDRAVFEDLRRADRSIGAKAVLAAHASRVDNVPVDDEGAFTDIDTPEAYEKAIGPRLTGG